MTAELLAVVLFGAMTMLGVGMVLGFLFARRSAGVVQYLCSGDCGHSLSMHDTTGKCRARDEYHIFECACQQYIGERPPPTYEELTRPPELPKELP